MGRRKTPLVLLSPAPTRWTSHFGSVSRMLLVKDELQEMAQTKKDTLLELAKGNEKHDIQTIIQDIASEDFWELAEDLEKILNPLARVSKIFQRQHLRLDNVLMCMLYLYRTLYHISLSAQVSQFLLETVAAVMFSLEKRWASLDQEIFICAVILNPFIGRNFQTIFRNSELGSSAEVRRILINQYKKLFGKKPNDNVLAMLHNYTGRERGFLSAEKMRQKGYENMFKDQVIMLTFFLYLSI